MGQPTDTRPRGPKAIPIYALLLALPLLAGPLDRRAAAQEAATPRWEFALSPYLWGTALEGDVGIGNTQAPVDVGFSDLLDDVAFGLMLRGDARRGDLGLFLDTVFARLERGETRRNLLDIEVQANTVILGGGVSYRAASWRLGATEDGVARTLALEPYAGVRWTYMDTEIDFNPGPSVDGDESWVDPIVGARLRANLGRRWHVTAEADIGGFGVGADLSWNVMAVVGYRFSLFGGDASFQFGYRALSQDYDESRFKWDVTMHGPILGFTFRF